MADPTSIKGMAAMAELSDAAMSAAQRDADVVEDIRTGNLSRAFDRVMQRYETKVYRLCLSFFREPSQAQDAAQESLVRIWRALSKYDGRAALSTWIYTITRNWCLTCLSQTRRTVSLSDEPVQYEVEALSAPGGQEGLDQASTLRRLVEELPDTTARVVALYYFEEQSVSEVSELTGLADGTVKTHLFRARAHLLKRLEELNLADAALWSTGARHG